MILVDSFNSSSYYTRPFFSLGYSVSSPAFTNKSYIYIYIVYIIYIYSEALYIFIAITRVVTYTYIYFLRTSFIFLLTLDTIDILRSLFAFCAM